MPRRPEIPPSLAAASLFSVAHAERAGLTRSQLRGKAWARVARGYYRPASAPVSSQAADLVLAQRRVRGSVLSVRTAAALWLSELPDKSPVWLTLPPDHRRPAGGGYDVIRCHLAPDDQRLLRRLPITSPVRTAFDCARLLPLADAVAEVDALLHARLVDPDQLTDYVASHPRLKGVPQARMVLELIDGRAESRMESRLRVLLVRSGIPKPEVNPTLYDAGGRFLARVDLLWRAQRFVVEYEGDHHREPGQYRSDLSRRYWLERSGYRVLPVTSTDYYRTPERTVTLVREELVQRVA